MQAQGWGHGVEPGTGDDAMPRDATRCHTTPRSAPQRPAAPCSATQRGGYRTTATGPAWGQMWWHWRCHPVPIPLRAHLDVGVRGDDVCQTLDGAHQEGAVVGEDLQREGGCSWGSCQPLGLWVGVPWGGGTRGVGATYLPQALLGHGAEAQDLPDDGHALQDVFGRCGRRGVSGDTCVCV